MAERVVDFLEMVEVHQQHGDHALLGLPGCYFFLHQFAKTGAIWQPGHQVCVGEAMDGFVCLPPLLPYARFAQFAIDCGHQPLQVAFQDVVVRARLHRGHRAILANGAGNNDEGEVQPAIM